MEIKIWDKKSDINGVSLEKLLSYRNDIKNAINTGEGVFLVSENNVDIHVDYIYFEHDLRNRYKLEESLTTEQVAQKYSELKQQEEQKEQEEALNFQKQQQEINALKKQNAELMYMMMQGGTI